MVLHTEKEMIKNAKMCSHNVLMKHKINKIILFPLTYFTCVRTISVLRYCLNLIYTPSIKAWFAYLGTIGIRCIGHFLNNKLDVGLLLFTIHSVISSHWLVRYPWGQKRMCSTVAFMLVNKSKNPQLITSMQ